MKNLLIKSTIFLSPVIPAVIFTSCSSENIETPKFPYIKLNITNIIGEVTQATVDEVIKKIDENILSQANIPNLSKVFTGINVENFDKFTISTTNNEITLTAKDNYTFSFDANEQESSIKSQIVIDLKIQLSSGNIEIKDMEESVKLLSEAGDDDNKKIQALNIVFENVNILNLSHFTWEIKNEKEDELFNIPTIILKANKGFIFINKKTLMSQVKNSDHKHI